MELVRGALYNWDIILGDDAATPRHRELVHVHSAPALSLLREKQSNAPTTMTLNWKPRFKSLCSICWVMVSKPTYAFARISSAGTAETAAAAMAESWSWTRGTGRRAGAATGRGRGGRASQLLGRRQRAGGVPRGKGAGELGLLRRRLRCAPAGWRRPARSAVRASPRLGPSAREQRGESISSHTTR